ncbi:hypothetical protein B0H19DRAFT_1003735 [Mycena capillaripes]|nr:hypothetical protein B0H19DRAFT_1003735 [Mycena capillaripes]
MVLAQDGHPAAFLDGPLSEPTSDPARQVEVLRYVWVGTAAIFIWDVLNNLRADYLLLFTFKARWGAVTYFTSRIICLVYILGFAILLTYPVDNCRTVGLALNSLYTTAAPCTSLLFFYRVRHIYRKDRRITLVFRVLWLAELGASMSVPFGTSGANIGSTRYCFVTKLAPYIGAAPIMRIIFDTAVFFATSYGLIQNTYTESSSSWRDKFRVFFSGAGLPSFSKSLLVDCQMYYMTTIPTNVAMSVLIFLPNVSAAYRSLPALPNLMLTSVMACRVYRHTRLVLAREPQGITVSDALGGIVESDNPHKTALQENPVVIPLEDSETRTDRQGTRKAPREEIV